MRKETGTSSPAAALRVSARRGALHMLYRELPPFAKQGGKKNTPTHPEHPKQTKLYVLQKPLLTPSAGDSLAALFGGENGDKVCLFKKKKQLTNSRKGCLWFTYQQEHLFILVFFAYQQQH